MKKLAFAALLIVTTSLLYAEADYRGGNGTLIRKETVGDKTIEVRKFEVSDFRAGLWVLDDCTIYDDYLKKTPIGSLEKDKMPEGGDYLLDSYTVLDFYEVCFVTDGNDGQRGELWVKLSSSKATGWVKTGNVCNPYADDNFSFLEIIKSGTENYQIRQYNLPVCWYRINYENANDNALVVRAKPGENAKKITEIKIENSKDLSMIETIKRFNAVAITEDRHWAKIEYEKGKYGWVSNQLYTDKCPFTERLYQLPTIGLPRLFTPEDIILIEFDFPPICPF